MNKIRCWKTLKLPSHFGLYFKKGIKIFTKNFHSFIDLGLQSDLWENESYSTFVEKAGFFMRKNPSKKLRIFHKVEMRDKVMHSFCR